MKFLLTSNCNLRPNCALDKKVKENRSPFFRASSATPHNLKALESLQLKLTKTWLPYVLNMVMLCEYYLGMSHRPIKASLENLRALFPLEFKSKTLS